MTLSSTTYALIVHGGAGADPVLDYREQDAHLRDLIANGRDRLLSGETALDTTVALVKAMEGSGLYVAGKGAAPNRDGIVELDASVMAGASREAGAVAALRNARHPIEAARRVMADGRNLMLAGEGASFQELRDQVATIRKATDDKGLARLRRMRSAVTQIWPSLQGEGQDGELAGDSQLLQQRLAGGTYYQATVEVDGALKSLETAYRSLYQERHDQRQAAFAEATDDVKAQPNWPLVPDEMQAATLKPLTDRAEHDLDLPEGALTCQVCGANLGQMASDLAAVGGLRSNVLLRAQELTAPEEKIERVRVSDVAGVGRTLSTSDDVDELLDELRDYLFKLIASDVKVILE